MTARLNRIFEASLASMMALLVATVSWQVISRYALGDPSVWTEELARFLLIWVSLFGGAYAYAKHSHLGLDLLAPRLRGQQRVWYIRISNLLVIAFSLAVLVVGGARLVQLTWMLGQTSAALQLPMAVVYMALPLSGLTLIFFCFGQIRRATVLAIEEGEEPSAEREKP